MSGLRASLCAAVFSVLLSASSNQVAVDAGTIAAPKIENNIADPEELDGWRRMKEGEVVVQLTEANQIKYVTGKILIHDNPANVWKVLANPYEFEKKIAPHMTKVEMLTDRAEYTVMRCRFDICPPIPSISYDVASDYRLNEEITFHRVGGAFKDFRGNWLLKPHEQGKSTEVIYSMYIDTGLPVPQWIVRKAVRMELPKTLIGLRERLHKQSTIGGAVVTRSIMAAQGLTTAHINQVTP